MPIKLPKGFQRRKSSGHALDEVQNPPQSSFRVLERNSDGSKSFDSGNSVRRAADLRPLSESQYLDYQQGSLRPNGGPYNRWVKFLAKKSNADRFSGSGGTQNSASSGVYDTSSSSARYSSTSTLPSASSIQAQDDAGKPHIKSSQTMPLQSATSSPSFLRAAGRTFSFGAKKALDTKPATANDLGLPHHSSDFTDIPDVNGPLRKRAMTETSHTSGSTATPPKISDAELNWRLSLVDGGEDFGNMFNNMNKEIKRKSVGGGGSLGLNKVREPNFRAVS
jgi:hypothetical protein